MIKTTSTIKQRHLIAVRTRLGRRQKRTILVHDIVDHSHR